MRPEETDTWQRFVVKFPDRFDTIDYDFRVGLGATVSEKEEDSYRRMVTMLSQKRIDALAWNDESPTIIEVKVRTGLSALGQVLGYKVLLEKHFPNFKKAKMLIVCRYIAQDDLDVLQESKIPVEVV